jgi:hypothetical protein
MKHIGALIVKYLMVLLILEIMLDLMTNLMFGDIMLIAVAVTLVSYAIGDLVILPLTSNIAAALADAGIALITIYLFNFWFGVGSISFADAFISAVFVGGGEWVFHRYLEKNVLRDRGEKKQY